MKMKNWGRTWAVFAWLIALALSACGGGGGGQDSDPTSPAVPPPDPPTLTLQTPVDGVYVEVGSVEFRGSFTGSAVTVSVEDFNAGQIVPRTVFESSVSPFAATVTVPASGFTTFTVSARNSAGEVTTRQMNVFKAQQTDSGLNHEVLGFKPTGTTLLATAEGALLYRLPDGIVRVRHADGTEVELENSAEVVPFEPPGPREPADPRAVPAWRMSANYVTTTGTTGTGTDARVFVWDSSFGVRTEIAYDFAADESSTLLRSHLTGPWLVWGERRIFLRNLDTQGIVYGPIDGRLSHGHAFIATADSEQLFFCRDNPDTSIDLFRYTLADGALTPLTAGGARNFLPKTDGSRLVWARPTFTTTDRFYELIETPISDVTAITVRPGLALAFGVDGGRLAWEEVVDGPHGPQSDMHLDDGAETITIVGSGEISTIFHSMANGKLLYTLQVPFRDRGLLVLDMNRVTRNVLAVPAPVTFIQHDGVIFFTEPLKDKIYIYRMVL
jgi:hypothetical protein